MIKWSTIYRSGPRGGAQEVYVPNSDSRQMIPAIVTNDPLWLTPLTCSQLFRLPVLTHVVALRENNRRH